jgi:excisionase family DNA binding protein
MNEHAISPCEVLLTKAEIAARFKVTSRTIDTWMRKRLLPFRKIGRTVRFDWTEVSEHLRSFDNNSPGKTPLFPAIGIARALKDEARKIRGSNVR